MTELFYDVMTELFFGVMTELVFGARYPGQISVCSWSVFVFLCGLAGLVSV
jgi:hypothetical protein